MSNEILFFIHIFACVSLVFLGFRMGKKALASMIVLQAVFANLFVVKQIVLFGFSVTCSDVFAIGGILGLNLLQDKYGKEEANGAVKASFLGLVFFMLMSKLHLAYFPIATDTTQAAFNEILSHSTRITLASIGVYYVIQKLDVFLFGLLEKIYLPIRIGISLVITQFLDTLLFSFVGLYGIVASLFDVMILSFCVKCIIIACCTIFTALIRREGKNVSI